MKQQANNSGGDGSEEGEIGVSGVEETTNGENLVSREGDVETARPQEGVTEGINFGTSVGDAPKDLENLVPSERNVGAEDGEFAMENNEVDMDLVDSPVRPVNVRVAGSLTVEDSSNSLSFGVNLENGCSNVQTESLVQKPVNDGNRGVKRARMTYEVEQASVHVTFNSLTRASKRKLEELLKQWSEWHVQHGSSSQDLTEVLESGEETYFPALHIGKEKPSAVSFWIENQSRKTKQDDGFIPIDGKYVPLYDRGYALGLTSADGPNNVEGGLEIVDEAARCFNCGSYSHSLRECPKPRDNAAVNIARKQHKSKRNQNSGSRNSTRYYQNSTGGKYDGLKPGALDSETRQLLGIAEHDPPPWLNRMRELGYPPGYLVPDVEDQPSGIIIFGDGDVKEEQEEDGEIIETDIPEPRRKKSVEFPGINAPIPENAEKRLWEAGPSSTVSFGNRSHRRLNISSEPTGRRHYQEQRWSSREFMDDGPPGLDPLFSPSSYPPRYGSHSSYPFESPRDSPHSLPRSYSERGRRGTAVYEEFASHSSYSSSPQSWTSKWDSPFDNGSVRSGRYDEYEGEDSWDEHDRHRDGGRRW